MDPWGRWVLASRCQPTANRWRLPSILSVDHQQHRGPLAASRHRLTSLLRPPPPAPTSDVQNRVRTPSHHVLAVDHPVTGGGGGCRTGAGEGPSSGRTVDPSNVLRASGFPRTPHLTSPHLTSPHLTSPHLTSPHLTSPNATPNAPVTRGRCRADCRSVPLPSL